MHQRLAQKTFTVDSMLPRTVARCVDCEHEIDTQSNLVVAMGNPGKVEEPLPIIKPKDE